MYNGCGSWLEMRVFLPQSELVPQSMSVKCLLMYHGCMQGSITNEWDQVSKLAWTRIRLRDSEDERDGVVPSRLP